MEEAMYKSHTCGELHAAQVGQHVTLAGWAHNIRTFGKVLFIVLRDRFGVIQVVSNPDLFPDAHKIMESVHLEWVVQIDGIVRMRPTDQFNPKMATGEIEVEAQT